MRGVVLPADMIDEIERILAQIHIKTKAGYLQLVDITGELISECGQMEDIDSVILATLAASNMAATTEMARQIGEKDPFKFFLHEGEKQNIYLSSIGDSFLLVVVFDTTVQVGLVRLYAKQAVSQLLPMTTKFEMLLPRVSEAVDAGFRDALASELENALHDDE